MTISSKEAAHPPRGSAMREVLVLFVLAVLFCAIYMALFLPYLPTAAMMVGGDYSLYFPSLLAGYYWYLHNGLWNLPWFSPSQCGGLPYFADPNTLYVSAPQFLTFGFGLLAATRITVVVFALIGFFGFFFLVRRSFGASLSAASLAAACFMFNGFFAARMLVGHMAVHGFMLLPVVGAAVIPPRGQRRPGLSGTILSVALTGSCFAYMVEAGMIHFLPICLLALTVILLLDALLGRWRLFPWAALVAGGLVGIGMSAGRSVQMLAFLANAPRDFYPLPGVPDFVTLTVAALQTVFLTPSDTLGKLIVNSKWFLERHEWEYGVSPVPALLMAVGTAISLPGAVRDMRSVAKLRRALPLLVLIAALLLVPLALNWYQPGWNALLKGMPFFSQSSNLLRWFCAYVPIAVLLGGLALDRITPPKRAGWLGGPTLATIGIGLMLGWNFHVDRRYYANQGYSATPIETAYAEAAATHSVPPIRAISAYVVSSGRVAMPGNRNDDLVRGYSQLACYQPLFGYRLERFPVETLHPGPALDAADGVLNLKNPACYVFPKANHCAPGDHFPASAQAEAAAFLDYRPFAFVMPGWQEAANWLGITSALVTLAAVLTASWRLGAAAAIANRLSRFRSTGDKSD